MKTFLWTTLFWIIVAIAWLLCLGFGNLGTQTVDNGRLLKIMPNNLKVASCDYEVIEPECVVAESCDCDNYIAEQEANLATEEWTQLASDIQESLNSIFENQVIIYNQMNTSFEAIQQMINNLTARYSAAWVWSEEVVDERELQRLQLQAQIEALQAEMANL